LKPALWPGLALAVSYAGVLLVFGAGMIGPMSTVLMSVAIVGEPFTAWMAAGTALVLAGVWLLARWR
jgi:drug/metabolite transporter (DMT)-like permease